MTTKQIEEMNQSSFAYALPIKDYDQNALALEAYEAGYKAAMEKAKVLEEALEWYAQEGEGLYTQSRLYLRAKSALKQYRGEQ